jgi:hypothetical protein
MALDGGVVQLLVRMLTPDWSLAVVDVESSEIGCVSLPWSSMSSWTMGAYGVTLASSYLSVAIFTEWMLLMVVAWCFGVASGKHGWFEYRVGGEP